MTTLTLEINPLKEREILSALKMIKGIQKITAQKAEPAWAKEARLMKAHPEWYPAYTDVSQMFADILEKDDAALFPNMPADVLQSLK